MTDVPKTAEHIHRRPTERRRVIASPCSYNPRGYIEWHAMAEEFEKNNIRQTRCPICNMWKYPNEECAERMVQRAAQDGNKHEN